MIGIASANGSLTVLGTKRTLRRKGANHDEGKDQNINLRMLMLSSIPTPIIEVIMDVPP